jgi:hypothetical protein
MTDISNLLEITTLRQSEYLPTLLKLSSPADKTTFDNLILDGKVTFVHDEIYVQLQELVKSMYPSVKIKNDEYPELISQHLNGRDIFTYGVWAYYPWSQRLVHLLDEEEFVEVRTNRNRYKITKEEQDLLKSKKIGIVGLSVGQSIALTLAIERTCGELRLADFDTAELSNLNRIRTGTFNLGINKAVIAAREIAEIDPYIKVIIFNDGLHAGNMEEFFTGKGKLDLFIEVCDGLNVKIESRYKAREHGIPVVMDTNDRGMLDVERFDTEPERAILHGLAEGLNPENIKDLTNEQKIPYILKMIGAETISTRLKASMLEVEQSINTWPQLASSVTLGGALTTDVSRRILLDQFHDSGRYYIDLEELVKDEKKVAAPKSIELNPYLPLENQTMAKIIDQYFLSAPEAEYEISESHLDQIIDAAVAAPSAGNNQPWKWVYSKGVLFLFHDKYRSWSWGDYYEMGSHMGLGAALENVHLQADALSLTDQVVLFPLGEETGLAATVRFIASSKPADANAVAMAENLFSRHTNRKIGVRQDINREFYKKIEHLVAQEKEIHLYYTENEEDLEILSEIIAECDKVRLLNELGHEEFYHEIRWSREEAERTRDGVELASVDITQSEIAGFKVAGDWKAVELLSKWDKGNAFKKLSTKAVKSASAMLTFAVDDFNHTQLINAGRVIQRVWILANQQGIAIHPMLSPAFFFNRLIHGKGKDIPEKVAGNLGQLRSKFLDVFPLDQGNQHRKEVFLMKVAIADSMGLPSLRKDKTELFYKF